MPVELLVVTTAFALIVLAMLYFSAKTAFAFRLAPVWQAVAARAGRNYDREERGFASAASAGRDAPPAEAHSRAATVVEAVAATQRRESAHIAVAASRSSGGGGEAGSAAQSAAAASSRPGPASLAPAPLGQSFRRRTRGRVSASAGRRDTRS
jgi:type IV secretion system protein VirB6